MRTTAWTPGWHRGGLRLWRRNEHGTWGYRGNPWYRLLPAAITERLFRAGLLPGRLYALHAAAVRWCGPRRSVYGWG